jgi:hypothetical protein
MRALWQRLPHGITLLIIGVVLNGAVVVHQRGWAIGRERWPVPADEPEE